VCVLENLWGGFEAVDGAGGQRAQQFGLHTDVETNIDDVLIRIEH